VVGELIGHGGMGAIYKGRQTRLGREVAIKFLLKLPGFTPMLSDRFRKETKIHMQLSHPNLVKLLDAGIYLGFPYIVMELIEGVSLQSSLGSGPLSPMSTLLAVADLIAQGLDYLAGQGVQHRDIKPANVILGPGKIVKICDFGLAHIDHDRNRAHHVFGLEGIDHQLSHDLIELVSVPREESLLGT